MADDKTREFSHESLQGRESILRYLEALGQGLERGKLRLTSGSETFMLDTPAMMKLAVRARQKGSRVDVVVKISWKDRKVKALKVEPLSRDEEKS
jgi:amphi-Trp domain-containing protein